MVNFHKVAVVAAIGATSYAAASPIESTPVLQSRTAGLLRLVFDDNLSAWKCIAPWLHASLPSFQWGCNAPGIPVWNGGDLAQCKWFWNWWTPYCRNGNQPKPLPSGCTPPTKGGQPVCQDGYQQVFQNYQTNATTGVYAGKIVSAATIDNDNYRGYILVDTLDKCLTACDQKNSCVFVNLYQDNADNPADVSELPPSVQSKYVKGNLTCALYAACSGTDKATNYGGQQDPTYITNSSGYCKGGKCPQQ